jgi:hypothetical protein
LQIRAINGRRIDQRRSDHGIDHHHTDSIDEINDSGLGSLGLRGESILKRSRQPQNSNSLARNQASRILHPYQGILQPSGPNSSSLSPIKQQQMYVHVSVYFY